MTGPAFAPLEVFRAAIEAVHGPTPHSDPLDGGIDARLLVLLETPGPGRDAPRFVSRDNPTGTARNLSRFLQATGLRREESLLWNTVPWIIHEPYARNRPPQAAEVAAGLVLLPGLLALLPALRVIVMAGRVAARAEPILAAARPEAALMRMPHPSPTFVNTSPAIGRHIAAVLAAARSALDDVNGSPCRGASCP